MHEVALMESVLEIVRTSAAERGLKRVHTVKLTVGEFSMAVPDSLQFAFAALATEDLFAGATLEIEARPLLCRCSDCGQDFAPADHYDLRCIYCAAGAVEITGGRELALEYYEGE